MRFADGFLSVKDTIKHHQEVLRRRRAVQIGKLGRTLSSARAALVNKQCEMGVRTYLFLVQKLKNQYQVYRGRIVNVTYELPQDEKPLIPDYYDELNITSQVSVWIKLSSLMNSSMHDLAKYRIASSKKSVRNAIRSSMAAMFIIEEAVCIDDW